MIEKTRYTPEEYLTIERNAELKSEFIGGEIVAMSGASRKHNRITLNVGSVLEAQFGKRPCEAFVSDMRVKLSEAGDYAYPDVVAVCGEAVFEDAELDTLVNPKLILEVLSDSTANYDRVAKFTLYQQIKTLRDYVLIEQSQPRVEHYARQENDQWQLTIATDLNDTIYLESIGCTLSLTEIYRKVSFTKETNS